VGDVYEVTQQANPAARVVYVDNDRCLFTACPASFLMAFVTMGAVHVSIDTTRCQGHGRCALIAPDVFDVDDSGKGKVLVDPCSGKFRAAAEEAEFSCPETAITVASSSI
jgi:ferredoxin